MPTATSPTLVPAPARRSDASADAAGFEAARGICRRHARSFFFASHLLPKPKRQAAHAVYAFCRMIDDAIDADDASIETAGGGLGIPPGLPVGDPLAARLGLFQERLDDIYAGRLRLSPPPVRSDAEHALHAFALTVGRYDIPRAYFLDLAEGCRMDLTVWRYPTWEALEKYCYHVAGVVGLIMSQVFGLEREAAREQAVLMGNAMQLTNILRDVKEDWDRGRIYLPREDMDRFGYGQQELAAGTVNDNFRELMRFEIARARDLYQRGAEGLCHLAADGSRATASAMAAFYSGILGAIERQEYDVFSRRAHLSAAQKLGRLPAAWNLARRRDGSPVPDVFTPLRAVALPQLPRP